MRRLFTAKFTLPLLGLIGLIASIAIVKLQPKMAHSVQARSSTPVHFISLQQHQLSPQIVGFGTVEPDLNLQAKAEISGRIIYQHPRLKKGEILPKGTVLLKIDYKDYDLQIKQSEADLLANKASLKEGRLNIANNQLDLKIAIEKLTVREREYARLQKLRKSGSISQSSLEAERQNILQLQQEVQQLKNKKSVLPSNLQVTKAQLAIAQARLAQSRRDLQRTSITLPFNGRISAVHTSLDQFVATGAPLFDASGLDKVVINAQFPIDQFGVFIKGLYADLVSIPVAKKGLKVNTILASLGLKARAEITSGNFQTWSATVERITDNLDPQSRTVGVVVSIQGNYQDLRPGIKPPLLSGMHMRVTLLGAATEVMVLPRFLLNRFVHNRNQVYRVSADNTLESVALSTLQMQNNIVLLKQGLQPGDKIITSDVFPAVEGMQLSPSVDNATEKQLAAWIKAAQ